MSSFLRRFLRVAPLLGAVAFSVARPALAWTSVAPMDADVALQLASDGAAVMRTKVRLEIRGGSFHGFELAPQGGASLRLDECLAQTDDGVRYALVAGQRPDGRTELALAGDATLQTGAITFTLFHQIDLIEQDSLRLYEGRARLDFTPLVWDWSFERMTFRLELPGPSKDAPIVFDAATTSDYEVEASATAATLTKFRAVRWYPMRVIAAFDPALIGRLAIGAASPTPLLAGRVPSAVAPRAAVERDELPLYGIAVAFAVVLGGLLALWRKAHHVEIAHAQVGLAPRFAVLPSTGLGLRAALSTGAALIGVAVQLTSSVAAGIPAIAVAALLILRGRTSQVRRPRPGGQWRLLDDVEESRYRMLSAAYRRSRSSVVDITTLRGAFAFAFFLAKLAAVVYVLRGQEPRLAWTVVADGLLLGVLAWFSNVRSELPHDALLEAFPLLDKWRKAARKLTGADAPALRLWVREDDAGPIEVRLRVPGRAEGLRGIEVAGEAVAAGTVQRIRPAFVARFDAGAATARALARSVFASEHHLTPDFAEEVVVLRARRGKDGALAPLRMALAL